MYCYDPRLQSNLRKVIKIFFNDKIFFNMIVSRSKTYPNYKKFIFYCVDDDSNINKRNLSSQQKKFIKMLFLKYVRSSYLLGSISSTFTPADPESVISCLS